MPVRPSDPPDDQRDLPAALPPSFARTELAVLMDTSHVNLLGNVHGGVIMRQVDSTAGAVAQRHSGGPAVTAAMDEMAFLLPVHVGDILRTMAQVNWAGRTSMEIGVRVETERWNEATGQPLHVASAYLVFVAIDEDGAPRQIPGLAPQDDRERRRVREAEIRRAHRLARKTEIDEGRTGAP
jgi:acyl-CoA hydrolase